MHVQYQHHFNWFIAGKRDLSGLSRATMVVDNTIWTPVWVFDVNKGLHMLNRTVL
jgi:hypothetical protein